MRVTKVVRVAADEWRVSFIDEHLPAYHQEEIVGTVRRKAGAWIPFAAVWDTECLEPVFATTGLKFDALYDAATALADAART